MWSDWQDLNRWPQIHSMKRQHHRLVRRAHLPRTKPLLVSLKTEVQVRTVCSPCCSTDVKMIFPRLFQKHISSSWLPVAVTVSRRVSIAPVRSSEPLTITFRMDYGRLMSTDCFRTEGLEPRRAAAAKQHLCRIRVSCRWCSLRKLEGIGMQRMQCNADVTMTESRLHGQHLSLWQPAQRGPSSSGPFCPFQ
jgi:hypothetical protein